MLVSKLALRNIFRNPRRTLLTLLLISSSLVAIVFTDAFTRGTVQTMVELSTDSLMGQAQIHKPGYRQAPDVNETIHGFSDLASRLDTANSIDGYSPRTVSGAMFSSAYDVTGGSLYGINPDQEAAVTDLEDKLIEGSYLTEGDDQVIIGSELAKRLDIGLGDRFVVTLSRAGDGELSQVLFRVSGIFRYSDRNLDSTLAFVHYDVMAKALQVNGPHQIAVRFKSLEIADDPLNSVWKISSEQWEFLPWRQLAPEINSILEMSGISTMIVSIILYILVAFSVINTMFMSIFERHREFGIQLALGTHARMIFGQLLAEGAIIGALGVAAGLILVTPLLYYGATVGIEYSDIEVSGVAMAKPIILQIEYPEVAKLAISLWFVVTLASVYPAKHASKLVPAIAMRPAI